LITGVGGIDHERKILDSGTLGYLYLPVFLINLLVLLRSKQLELRPFERKSAALMEYST
jgi:hypothetical protein